MPVRSSWARLLLAALALAAVACSERGVTPARPPRTPVGTTDGVRTVAAHVSKSIDFP